MTPVGPEFTPRPGDGEDSAQAGPLEGALLRTPASLPEYKEIDLENFPHDAQLVINALLRREQGYQRRITGLERTVDRLSGDVIRTKRLLTDAEAELTVMERNIEILRRRAQEAMTDSLTLLPNRRHFDQQLPRYLEEAHRRGRRASDTTGGSVLGVMDLDGFKVVNDTFGHAAGDRVLKVVASRLRGEVRFDEGVWRWGGDEFALVAHDISGKDQMVGYGQRIIKAVTEAAQTLAEDQGFIAEIRAYRLDKSIPGMYIDEKIIDMDTRQILNAVAASIGIVPITVDYPTADVLLARADALMYAAKSARKDESRPEEERAGLVAIANGTGDHDDDSPEHVIYVRHVDTYDREG